MAAAQFSAEGLIFDLPGAGAKRFLGGVSRAPLLLLLLGALLLALVFAGWRLMRPYDAEKDPQAAYQVKVVTITEDHGYCWLAIDLRSKPGNPAATPEVVILLTGEDGRIEPAALGAPLRPGGAGPSVRFWLRATQLDGPLTLVVGSDRLRVKLAGPAPELADGQTLTLRRTLW